MSFAGLGRNYSIGWCDIICGVQMTTKPRLTAVERKGRKEIKALIREARIIAEKRRSYNYCEIARVLDDLADLAEKYLKTTANQPDE